jgi:hypothetical protein
MMNLRQHSRHSTLLEDEIIRVASVSAVAIDGENSFRYRTKVEQRRQRLGIDFTGVSGEQSKLLFRFIPAC